MAGVKITTFLGTAPKISPELLPNTAAQIASNCKLYSGDLIPYPQPVVAGNTDRTGTIKTLYALRDPVTSALRWLSWTTDVDIVTAIETDDSTQRFYYTGDGAPKVSTYALATASSPYPAGYYDLGLPLPPDSATLTTTAATFTQKTSASYARDNNNVATIVTSAAHGLRTGNFVSVSGFTFLTGTYNQAGTSTITVTITGHGLSEGASVTLDFTSGTATDGTFVITNVAANTFDVVAPSSATTSGDVRLDIRSFNATNVECTVTNSTTFTYFSPGPSFATTVSLAGKVDLGGLTQARSYVFTWYTPWEEESVASKPSTTLYIKEGITVTVSNLPTAAPTGNNFIRGVRLYRTLASSAGTEYFLLNTLWFPTGIANVQRTSNVSRVRLAFPHNFAIGDRFKISGCSVASFNITGGIVTEIIDDNTFEYSQVAANVSSTAATGTLYHDVSENPPTTTARYWGDGSYDFTDDFDSTLLTTILASDNYDPPPEDLEGLTAIQGQIVCGFVGNKLYFSEVAKPHAWPPEFVQTIEHQIVGIAPLGGSALVMTNGYPYVVQGSDPASLNVARVDVLYPCLNRRSIVPMNYGVVYSTHDGLAVAAPGGTQLITRLLYNNDTWQTALNPSTVVAEYYGDAYLASHSTGSFVFERDEKVGGYFVTTPYQFTASWYDEVTGKLYYVSGTNGDIYEWDNLSQPPVTQEWKSKVIVTQNMINLGAARVIADYAAETAIWDSVSTQWQNTTASWNSTDPVTFQLWVDKQLLYTTTVADKDVFRLPTGYRSDTFEVGVTSNIRVRAIHLAETSLGLREV
jgi:hypothetical protein